MPFQPGNQEHKKAAKAKLWRDAIQRAIKRREDADPLALEKLADRLLAKVAEGDVSAIKEFGDRLDGKVAQPTGGDEELGPIKHEISWKFGTSKSTTSQENSSSPSTTEPSDLPVLSPTDEPVKP
jgi:hypothetical protein